MTSPPSGCSHTPSSGPSPPRKWWALAGIALGVLMATLDAGIVNISLPTLSETLHVSFAVVQWVILSYMLAVTSFILCVARLGDMYEKKKLYAGGMALFTGSSLLCGLSPSAAWLIGFRALQGTGAVMMQALGAAIVTEVFPSSQRGRALGVMGGAVAIGLALGPPLGGILIGVAGWRSIFLINIPLGLIALPVVIRFVPPCAPRERNPRFDWAGAAILFATLLSYALGMTLGQQWGFHRAAVLVLLAGASGGLALFVGVERRMEQPMLELRLFRNPLLGLHLLMGFLMFTVVVGTFVLPFFLETGKGYPPEQVGLLMMTIPLSMGFVAPLAGAFSDRFGSRGIAVAGLLVAAGGCLAIASLGRDTSTLGCAARLAPLGLGVGLFMSPNNSAVMGSVPSHRLGIGAGLLSLSRTLGQTSGLPLMGAVFAAYALGGSLSPQSKLPALSPKALAAGVAGTFHTAAFLLAAAAALGVAALFLERRYEHP